MKKYAVNFLPSRASVTVEEGTTILKAAERAGVYLNSVCGGEGTCGKCRVAILYGETREPATALLTAEELADGVRLACRSSVHSYLTLEVPKETAVLDTAGGEEEASRRFGDREGIAAGRAGLDFSPLAVEVLLELSPPTLEDNRDDLARLFRRLKEKTGFNAFSLSLPLLRELPLLLRESGWKIAAAVAGEEGRGQVLRIEAAGGNGGIYGLAVDIGTTTVAAHLVDLADGRTRAAGATYNSQIGRGEDVIKRIIRSEEEGTGPLSAAVHGDINDLAGKLCREAGVSPESILAVCAAGNSTMTALLLGVTPRQIRREPYIPPFSFPPLLRAADAGIRVHKNAVLSCVPGIAGWVGGDITAGILASGLDRSAQLSLLIDIGTNGEIVVGNQEWMLACSCSAGPAFEGSGIASGSRAVAGAIERIDIPDGLTPAWETIGDEPPIGICGSGLLDAVAELFRTGILGRDGRFNAEHPSPGLSTLDGLAVFTVVPAELSGNDRAIVITQADIDNLIRAKAAIYAGISVLLKAVNLEADRLERVFISGGFGNYINIERARAIGLIPGISPEKISFIGNGSLRGAKLLLLSDQARRAAARIAGGATYRELSVDKNFMEEYIKAMFLPHTDVEKFYGISH